MPSLMPRNGIFYGWFILAVSFFVLFVSTGARNGVGVFVIPMSDDFGWSRTSISLAIAIGWLVNGITIPISQSTPKTAVLVGGRPEPSWRWYNLSFPHGSGSVLTRIHTECRSTPDGVPATTQYSYVVLSWMP